MIEVTIPDLDPNQVMEIVRNLRAQGLQQGTDFDFAYNKPTWDYITGHSITQRHTVFTFHSERYATFFTLKYSK
jgi:hypothetical protein